MYKSKNNKSKKNKLWSSKKSKKVTQKLYGGFNNNNKNNNNKNKSRKYLKEKLSILTDEERNFMTLDELLTDANLEDYIHYSEMASVSGATHSINLEKEGGILHKLEALANKKELYEQEVKNKNNARKAEML